MKRITALLIVLSLSMALLAQGYNFSAVSPSGQTLYYSYTNGSTGNSVKVTHPYHYNSSIPYNGYTKPTGTLTIPSSVSFGGRTYSVTSIGSSAFKGCDGLTSVYIPSSVTSIEGSAFYRCTGISYVSIPNSVTNIGTAAFYRCTGLTSIYVPNSVTWIDSYAFNWCTNLISVSIPNSVTYIGCCVFAYCTSLTSVSIPNTVTEWAGLFEGCASLTSVSIPNAVTYIGHYTFEGCTSLTSVSIPDSVTFIGDRAFKGCTSLTSLSIPNAVTYIGNRTFAGCTSLTSVSIGYSDTIIGQRAFDSCTNLSTITSFATIAPSLCTDAFSGVPTNIDVNIPCGSWTSYNNRWTCFSNFIESDSYIIHAVSSNETIGQVNVLVAPTCESPNAVIGSSANYGYHFTQWSDGNTDNPRTIVLTQDTQFVAMFAKNQYSVVGITDDSIKGIVSGSDTVNYLDGVTLTAIANNGYHFTHWSDGDTTNPYVLTVTCDTTVIAYFDIGCEPEWDTLYVHDTITVHDTAYVEVPYPVHDTTYVNVYVHDTTFVPYPVHDTIVMTDTVTLTEYVPVHDTTYISMTDTLTVTQYDTIINTVFDTIDNFIYDTLTITDTLWLTQYDTLWLHDTIIIHDTIYITQEGIDGVDALNAKVYSCQGQIVVEGVDGNTVWLYDINGRILANRRDDFTPMRFDAPASGTYLIKIGNHAARKVVVIR